MYRRIICRRRFSSDLPGVIQGRSRTVAPAQRVQVGLLAAAVEKRALRTIREIGSSNDLPGIINRRGGLEGPPSVPRSVFPPTEKRNACVSDGVESPQIWPVELMPEARLKCPPKS